MSGTDISLRYLLFGEDKTATSTVGKIGGAFNKLGSYVGGEFGEILDKVGDGIDRMGEHAKTMGAKFTGAGAVVGGVGIAFQLAGSREAQGAAQLNAAIDATGKSHEDYGEDVEKAIKANEKFGFGAADTQQALAKLTAATNSPEKALADMGVAANLAASQHISLADASKMLARVQSGTGGRVLAQYGIQMDLTKTKTQAGQIALEQLSKKLSGQASASVDSFGGKIKVAQTKIGDLTAQIGQKFGPALTVAGPLLMGLGSIMELVTARQAAAAAATDAETASQTGLNVAMLANPITLIVVGIALLVAGFILLYTHSERFRAIVQDTFHVATAVIMGTYNWVKSNWPLLLGILTGPIGLAIVWVTKHWSTVTGIFSDAKKIIGKALSAVTNAIEAPFKLAFDFITTAWGKLQTLLNGGKITGGSFVTVSGSGSPKPPGRKAGGPVSANTPYLVGEEHAEIFVPPQGGTMLTGLGGGGGDVHIHMEGATFIGPSKAQIGDWVIGGLVDWQRQNRRPIPASVTGQISG